ncbi:hypothetical protein [Bartonella sp. B41]
MTDENYPIYEKHTTEEKKNSEQHNLIGKGILVIVLTFIVILFILGYFFEKSSRYDSTSNHSTTGSDQTVITPRKSLNAMPPQPPVDKDTVPSVFHEKDLLK